MTDVIKEFWAIIAGIGAAVVWLVRLEARGLANAADIRRLWSQRKEDGEAAKESRANVEKKIDELMGMSRVQTEDIKQLIREGRGK